jgi:hypothetical protein
LESLNLQASHQNTLNLQALRRIPVRPLDSNLLSKVVNPAYVELINEQVKSSLKPSGVKDRLLDRLLEIRKVGGALRRFGFVTNDIRRLKGYFAYLVLVPIEVLLRRQELGQKT